MTKNVPSVCVRVVDGRWMERHRVMCGGHPGAYHLGTKSLAATLCALKVPVPSPHNVDHHPASCEMGLHLVQGSASRL